jgi:hypothetical protein
MFGCNQRSLHTIARSGTLPRAGVDLLQSAYPILAPRRCPLGRPGEGAAIDVVGGTADRTEGAEGLAQRLGISAGSTVQEIGYDTDTDDSIIEAVRVGSGEDPVDEDFDGVVDVVLAWWREQDGDLADALVDAKAPLAATGVIWLFTPKHGRPGALEPADIADAATTAGLRRTTSVTLQAWHGIRMISR